MPKGRSTIPLLRAIRSSADVAVSSLVWQGVNWSTEANDGVSPLGLIIERLDRNTDLLTRHRLVGMLHQGLIHGRSPLGVCRTPRYGYNALNVLLTTASLTHGERHGVGPLVRQCLSQGMALSLPETAERMAPALALFAAYAPALVEGTTNPVAEAVDLWRALVRAGADPTLTVPYARKISEWARDRKATQGHVLHALVHYLYESQVLAKHRAAVPLYTALIEEAAQGEVDWVTPVCERVTESQGGPQHFKEDLWTYAQRLHRQSGAKLGEALGHLEAARWRPELEARVTPVPRRPRL